MSESDGKYSSSDPLLAKMLGTPILSSSLDIMVNHTGLKLTNKTNKFCSLIENNNKQHQCVYTTGLE